MRTMPFFSSSQATPCAAANPCNRSSPRRTLTRVNLLVSCIVLPSLRTSGGFQAGHGAQNSANAAGQFTGELKRFYPARSSDSLKQRRVDFREGIQGPAVSNACCLSREDH